MIMDLMQLQTMLDHCIKPFDHQLLNEIEPFNCNNPTSENIAKFIFDAMAKRIPEHVSVACVTVHEVDAFSVTYSGE
ncbi:MAG: 6-carboxytetrahydropterin synthase [candidate division KSB1 bacterium]|nr:6-carboxytetrahydropterin synthase [candidate division KSB1 bacterium]